MKAHIIGAGIAGMSLAHELANRGTETSVYERDHTAFGHSSSRNAAMLRSYEADPYLSLLVKRSIDTYYALEERTGPLIHECGLLIDPLEVDYFEDDYLAAHPQSRLQRSRPHQYTLGTRQYQGTLLPNNGVLNLDRYRDFLLRNGKEMGVQLHTNCELTAMIVDNRRIVSLQLGEMQIEMNDNDVVINAAGSWSRSLLERQALWAPPLLAHKRHLFTLQNQLGADDLPIIWLEPSDIYIRPDPDGQSIIATHCDEKPSAASDYANIDAERSAFQKILSREFPALAACEMLGYQACLRTFPLDGRPVTGFDPYIENVFWLAGWGGRGITMAPAMAEIGTYLLTAGRKENETEVDNPWSAFRFI